MLSSNLSENEKQLKELLRFDQNFDIVARPVTLSGRSALFFFIDGFVKDDLFERILSYLYRIPAHLYDSSANVFERAALPYCETALAQDLTMLTNAVLSGQTALLIDGFDSALLLDLRSYPQRDTAEPEKDKTFRGSRDGFLETVVLNCALLRRRIRSPQLCMEALSVGTLSQTDVTLCYMADRVNKPLLEKVRNRLASTPIPALTMNQESLAEVLMPHKWYNPLPKFKYTERPDTAAAQVLDGNIVILIDNCPSAMMLPTTLFDILEEANDFYFPPFTGTYLRLTRLAVFLVMLLLTPVWLLLLQNPDWAPLWLEFILLREDPIVPVFLQLILLEIGIDGLKLAAVNTPNMLTTALSIVAGIVVSDFAVQSGWFSAEPMLYMAIVAIGSYNQPSYELGYAIKFMRVFLLACVYFLGTAGFVGGLLAVFLIFACNKTFAGTPYLYPLIPLNLKALKKKLVRSHLKP